MLNKRSTPRSAFTLIELMLVMVLLVIVVSLVTPTLEKFFVGRTLDSEVRQFLSLIHYGQSRAVSEGIPTVLWVDAKKGTYGMCLETGYADNDDRAVQYSIGDGLTVGLDTGAGKAGLPGKLTGIHFSPEGMPVTGTSVAGVYFQQGKNPAVWIRRSADGLNYEVQ